MTGTLIPFWFFFTILGKIFEKIRTHCRLALSSDFRVLMEATGIEPVNIIFYSKFSRVTGTFNRRFI